MSAARPTRAPAWAPLALALWLVGSAAAAKDPPCAAPAPVCAARDAVFAVSAFDPLASAVRIGPDLLVTNRHVVADAARAVLVLRDGRRIEAEVVPSAYAGDLALLRAAGLDPGPALAPAEAAPGGALYTVAADAAGGRVRVYPPGRPIVGPAPGKPLARLHHSAPSEPGNSGGALLDAAGRLVGIVSAGGQGRYEAIPAARVAALRAESGPAYRDADRRLGAAYRACIEALDRAERGGPGLDEARAQALQRACGASGNRQLFDLAAQALGRAGRLARSQAMFERALEQDPHALNARIGLVVTLHLARRYGAAVAHASWLLDVLPEDRQVLRLAVVSGKWGGAPGLAERALALLEAHHPLLAPSARRFLDSEAGPPARRP
ncbi:MAG: trypsin-like peptidase domain-containing protein [Kiloniellaceae bacterium]